MTRNGGVIIKFMLIPAVLFGLAALYYFFFPINSGSRMDYVSGLLLSIIFLTLIFVSKIPLHEEIVYLENFCIYLVYFTFFILIWIGVLFYIYNQFKHPLEHCKDLQLFDQKNSFYFH
jgi:hypothetical protein